MMMIITLPVMLGPSVHLTEQESPVVSAIWGQRHNNMEMQWLMAFA